MPPEPPPDRLSLPAPVSETRTIATTCTDALGFRVSGFGFRVSGLGFGVSSRKTPLESSKSRAPRLLVGDEGIRALYIIP